MSTERLRAWVLFPALAAAGAAVPLPAVSAADGEGIPVLTVLERTAEPLLRADRPWESMGIGLDAPTGSTMAAPVCAMMPVPRSTTSTAELAASC
jgi:hypothetical protein